MKNVLPLILLFIGVNAIAQEYQPSSISKVEPNNIHIPRSEYNLVKSPFASKTTEEYSELTTPNPSPEAVALYRYIQDMFGKQTFSGQQWVQWGINEMNYIQSKTGEKPAIAGFDYINENENAEENRRAIAYWNNGGIVTFMYHQGAPSIGEGYENSKGSIDIDQIFIEGTPENVDFWGDMERIGDYLQELEDANVPVLWRPYHELTGNWFWWSKDGAENFKKLWITTYDYLVVERELSNLIWVLCYTANPKADWYPGDDYVDLAGADTYDNTKDSHLNMFNSVVSAIGDKNCPIVFHENGNPPDPQACLADNAMWSWWMIWHTEWLDGSGSQSAELEHIREVYKSDLVITFDELPDFVSDYGWASDCQRSAITAHVQFSDGETYDLNKIGLADGQATVTMTVDTQDEGTWLWSGYGITADTDVAAATQDITIDGIGTTMARFTNACGAITTQTFDVVDGYVVFAPLAVSDKFSDKISVYPSPASDKLNVNLTAQIDLKDASYKLFDMKGTVLLENKINTTTQSINISGLKTGIYGLLITANGQTSFQKFAKQ